ncbi:MAG: hypothetical protein WCH57_05695 [Verrucomicrobiota bacterium]
MSTPRANPRFLRLRQARLRRNPTALAWLHQSGLDDATINQFALGLSTPYTTTQGELQADALVFPLIGPTGEMLKRAGYAAIPGVTNGTRGSGFWSPGPPQEYYSGPRTGRNVLVAVDPLDVWLAWQHLHGTTLAPLLILGSTYRTSAPSQWLDPQCWAPWERVFVVSDPRRALAPFPHLHLGEQIRSVEFRSAAGDLISLASAFADGVLDADLLREKLEGTRVLKPAPPSVSSLAECHHPNEQERRQYVPLEIRCGTCINGELYYPLDTIVSTPNPVGHLIEKIETVVVCSNRTLLTPKQGIYGLNHLGNLAIEGSPRSNPCASWRWPSVSDYLEGRSPKRGLGEILRDVEEFLRSSVWLPDPKHYSLLTFTVPVTYAQSLFDAVPLILVTGPRGSGKTVLGRAMATVCANSCIVGAASVAAMARQIDEARGLVVFDDLESISPRKKSPESAQFSALVQTLKLGYNQAAGTKTWADPRTFHARRLDLFGVKMVNNTAGSDPILASRALRIATAPVSPGSAKGLRGLAVSDRERLARLRDELHCWVFANVDPIAEAYRKLAFSVSDRQDEIATPLRVFAQLSQDEALRFDFEAALDSQRLMASQWSNPDDLLIEAAKALVRAGYNKCTPTHLALEMRRLTGNAYFADLATPEWVGRSARRLGLFTPGSSCERHRLFGCYLRVYRFSDDLQKEAPRTGALPKDAHMNPLGFCRQCATCVYRELQCPVMPFRG